MSHFEALFWSYFGRRIQDVWARYK